MTANEEFRVILTPLVPPLSVPPGWTREWSVELDNCPIRALNGRKGMTTSKVTKQLLAELRSGTFRASEPLLREVGNKVWQSLMTPELSAAFESCLNVVQMKHLALRIVIVPRSSDKPLPATDDMADLAELPFELLHRPAGSILPPYVAMDESTPIIRGMADEDTLESYGVAGPLRILVVISAPSDFPPIAAAEEKKAIQDALRAEVAEGRVHLEFCELATLDQLYTKMRESWHVLHFAGHGGIETGDDNLPSAYLAFVKAGAGPNPESHKVSAENLATTLTSARGLKLVVLTACVSAQSTPSKQAFDSIAHYLMTRSELAAVVAMQFDLETEAAGVFSKEFYSGLTAKPIDLLMHDARQRLKLNIGLGHRAWANPTILSRCRDSQIFHNVCDLPPASEAQLTDLKTLIEASREALLDLFRHLTGLSAEHRSILADFRKESQDNLTKKLQEQAEVLGEAIRLIPVNAPPGNTALCRLVLRPRQATDIQSFRLKVRIPTTELAYVSWLPPQGLLAKRTITAVPPLGDDVEIVYLDTATNRQPYPAGQDHELGQIELRVVNGRPASIVDLRFPEEPEIVSPQQTCFRGLGGLVIIDFPP